MCAHTDYYSSVVQLYDTDSFKTDRPAIDGSGIPDYAPRAPRISQIIESYPPDVASV